MTFLASFEKTAWDSFESDAKNHIWAANRCVHGDGFVHKALVRAAKNKDIVVEVAGDHPEGYIQADSKSPKEFRSVMQKIREDIGKEPKKLDDDSMDWSRNYSWQIFFPKKKFGNDSKKAIQFMHRKLGDL